MDLKAELDNLKSQIENDLETSNNLDEVYLKYFSKTNGAILPFIKGLPKMSNEDKKTFGPMINELQTYYKNLIEEKKGDMRKDEIINADLDLTYPEIADNIGYLHPTTQVIREMNKFFRYHGFSIYEGPEIETAEYNFRKLNLPEDHPATDLQDTLFVMEPDVLLRTHTSSIEARALSSLEPPIRIVSPGKCYRNETPNKTNSSFFYQYQGVVVDKGINLGNLKATLTQVHKFLFGEDTKLRFRYKYYPEVSPGMGVDMMCKFCSGSGCEVCKMRGWIEMLGSGMIHYNTLKMCGLDPEVYTGFAFGMGLDRQVMTKFAVKDIRKLYGGGVVYK